MNVKKKWYVVLLVLVTVAAIVAVCPALRVSAEEAEEAETEPIVTVEEVPEEDTPDVIPEPDTVQQIADAVIEKLKNTDGEDFSTYFKEKVLPLVVAALSTLTGLYVVVYPMICKARNVTERFKKNAEDCAEAAGGFSDAIKAVREAKDKGSEAIEAAQALMAKQTEELKNTVGEVLRENAKLKEEIETMRADCKNAVEIARIGFGNMAELVNGGIAKEIAKVGTEVDENAEDAAETDRS